MNDLLVTNIIDACFLHYEKIITKNGKAITGKEWTVLSAIVKVEKSKQEPIGKHDVQVVSVGTGTKCIGEALISRDGCMVHDSHAEVIARRSFLCYLYEQIEHLCKDKKSIFQKGTKEKKKEEGEKEKDEEKGENDEGERSAREKPSSGLYLKENIDFFMFSTATPCGDASITEQHLCGNDDDADNDDDGADDDEDVEEEEVGFEVASDPPCKRRRFEVADSDEGRTGAKVVVEGGGEESGRQAAGQATGQLRTKPGKGDRSRSLSCSDKMCRWAFMGVQGALLMHFLARPIYLKGLIISSPKCDVTALARGVGGRLEGAVVDALQVTCFRLNLPSLHHLPDKLFVHSRIKNTPLNPSPCAICWYESDSSKRQEVVVRGRLLGATKKNRKTPFVSQASLFKTFLSTKKLLQANKYDVDSCVTYGDFKAASSEHHTVFSLLKQTCLLHWPSIHPSFYQFTCSS